MAIRVVSWNVAKRHAPWRELVEMDVDVALLQEAGNCPADVADRVDTGPPESWDSHRILAAGDLNMSYGDLDVLPQNLAARAQTVFDRMDALGLELLGPQAPEGGRQADPTPAWLPPDTRNVPTYRSNRQTPETAVNQLDYVFASRGFHEQVAVRALNSPDEWGPSDHCRILIEVEDD